VSCLSCPIPKRVPLKVLRRISLGSVVRTPPSAPDRVGTRAAARNLAWRHWLSHRKKGHFGRRVHCCVCCRACSTKSAASLERLRSEIVRYLHLAPIDLSMLRVCLFATWACIPHRWRRRGRACQVEVVPRSAVRVLNLSHFKRLAPDVAAVIAGEFVLLQITISNHYQPRYRQLVSRTLAPTSNIAPWSGSRPTRRRRIINDLVERASDSPVTL